MKSLLIKLQNVNVTLTASHGASVKVLNNVTLGVEEGDFLSILGPSGCGKSTLLRIMADLLKPSGGQCEWRSGLLEKRGVAMAMNFQKPVLLPWHTVEQNALLPFRLSKEPVTDVYTERLEKLLRMVGLYGFRNALPYELSGGMQMRAVFVRTFLSKPSLIIMDEPFSALDEVTRNRLGYELRQLAKQTGATIVFVTHSIQEAVFLSTRVVLMSPRPAHIVEDMEIDLPETREEQSRRSSHFLDLCDHLQRKIAHG